MGDDATVGIFENGSLMKSLRIGILILLCGGFIAYTVHKIYVEDPKVYAYKIDLVKLEIQSKSEREANADISLQNRETISVIQSDLSWLKDSQLAVKDQNKEILKVLLSIRDKK